MLFTQVYGLVTDSLRGSVTDSLKGIRQRLFERNKLQII